MKQTDIKIFTDGSSLGNPGPGGFGCVVVLGDSVIELGGYEKETTNNRMEMTAILTALEYLKKQNVSPDASITLFTDSSYAINGITKWVAGWQKNNWITSTKTQVLNDDIWKQLVPLTKYFTHLKFHHVKGHAGIWGNERCDEIATSFSSKKEIKLFSGRLSDYNQEIHSIKPSATTTSSSKKKSSEKAYSYVSLLNGTVRTHTNWDDCKARVHGKPAKFQKVFSKSEETELINKWKSL